MEPTLLDGDVVLVDKRAYTGASPNEGDIVVARHPHRELEIVKRVQFVDGGVYVRGDNRTEESAQDSRSFGVVPTELIRGRVTSVVRTRSGRA